MDQFWAYSWWCEFGFVLSIYCHIIPGPSKLVVATCLLSDWLNSFCNIICQIALNIIWSLSARLTGTPLCQRAFSLETIWGWSFGPKVNLGVKFSHWRQSGGEGLVQRFVPWGNLGVKFSHWRQSGGEGLVQRFVPWHNLGMKFSHWRQSGGWGFGPKVRPLRQSGGEVFSLEAIWGWGFGPKVRHLRQSEFEVIIGAKLAVC